MIWLKLLGVLSIVVFGISLNYAIEFERARRRKVKHD